MSQTLDRNLYLQLLNADSAKFVQYSTKSGFEITETPILLIARSHDFSFKKPLATKRKLGWNTILVVTTKSKANNQIIYQNAKRSKKHKNSLADKNFLYIESEMQDQLTGQFWYKIEVLKIYDIAYLLNNADK